MSQKALQNEEFEPRLKCLFTLKRFFPKWPLVELALTLVRGPVNCRLCADFVVFRPA